MSQKKSIQEIYQENKNRESPLKKPETWVWLHDIRSAHNVGAAFRTADAFGISGILLSGFTPYPPKAEISKTALGAEESVKWQHFDDPNKIFEVFSSNFYSYLAIEQTHGSKSLIDYEAHPTKGRILLFGNEVHGVDEHLITKMNDYIEIPQYGIKHSLNISVALGVVLYGFLSKTI